jgi:rubrerythrin
MMFYQSAFRDWHSRSSVRTKAPRVLAGSSRERLYFAPELVPACQHPLVAEADAAEPLLVHFLHHYLEFTTRLEHEIVGVALQSIVSREFEGILPEPMVGDAYKLLCDEAYHAHQSDDLSRQVTRQTGIDSGRGCTPRFMSMFEALPREFPDDHAKLARLFMVIVSETLVSKTLQLISRSERVHEAVSEVVKDHAVDEARHNRYFAAVLQRVWPTLTTMEKEKFGAQIPGFIHAFLAPDYDVIAHLLCETGFERDAALQIVSESYHEEDVRTGIRAASHSTMAAATRAGVLAVPTIAAEFRRMGLLRPTNGNGESLSARPYQAQSAASGDRKHG